MEKSLNEMIVEAIEEAQYLEGGLDDFDEEHMLFVAQKLSGAPHFFVEEVYRQIS